MKKQARAARRQRIPAFGEWNYDYGYGGGDWSVTQYFDSAMMHAGGGMLVATSPSKRVKKVVKWSDSATLKAEEEKQLQRHQHQHQHQHKVVVGMGDHGQGSVVNTASKKKQSRVADAADYKQRVVKAVDQDLYEIPPDMLCHKPTSRKRLTTRRRRRRSVWLGCLALSCVAA